MIVNYGDGGSWTDWSKSIDEIVKMDFDVVIPGHGPAVTKAQLIDIRSKFGAIQARVRTMNREKKTQDEITRGAGQRIQLGSRAFRWTNPRDDDGVALGPLPPVKLYFLDQSLYETSNHAIFDVPFPQFRFAAWVGSSLEPKISLACEGNFHR